MEIKAAEKTHIGTLPFPAVVFALSVICVGLFFEWLSCLASAVLLIWLFIRLVKDGGLTVKLSLTFITVSLLVTFYLLSVLWAEDRGMAAVGFFKFLPVPLFALCLMQRDGYRASLIGLLPPLAAVSVVLSAAFMYIPFIKNYFNVAGRMAGFFEYPNTFAIFLLVSTLVAAARASESKINYVYCAVSALGILATGSRTVFVLSVLSGAALFICRAQKRKRAVLIVAAVAALGAAAVIYASVCEVPQYLRFLKINLGESTFVGRLLYFKDALPVILKHPFGLGYAGYYYMQESFQTGIYTVKYVHNDLMQIMLDVGWIPAGLFAAAMVRSLIKAPPQGKIILSVMVLHFCFDFDLQFIAVFFLLILFCDLDFGAAVTLGRGAKYLAVPLALLLAVNLYFCAGMCLSSLGATAAADKMLPFYTDNKVKMLSAETEVVRANETANELIECNKNISAAYSAKAKYAYSNGNFLDVITNMRSALKYKTFAYNDCREYCYMLINGVSLYSRAGDDYSAQVCAKELVAVKNLYNENLGKLSRLGKMINDTPEEALPEDIVYYIKNLETNGID